MDPWLYGEKGYVMTNNTILTNRAFEVITAIAISNDSLTAGTKIYEISRPDYTPDWLKEINCGIASAIYEEGGCVPTRMMLSDIDKASIREFIRMATGHRWHHSFLPHRLTKVGRAARVLVG